ncbi:MAG TPA: hypothetical protein ENI33_02190 [Thermoplasmatales archaeon]|nr:hypothetical protein [Thermoplasmatales archaeon]
MGEDNIHRTTIYIPKKLYIIAKSMDINMSQSFSKYLEQLIKEDPETIIMKEIEEYKEKIRQLEAKLQIIREKKKQQQEKEKAIENVAQRIAEWLSKRLFNIPETDSNRFMRKTKEIIIKNYGVNIDENTLYDFAEKIKGNGGLKKEDIMEVLEIA